MTTLIPEANGILAATASSKKPKAKKRPRVAPRRAHVAPAPKSPTKEGPQKRKSAVKSGVLRDGSKTAKLLTC
jgi:hypothetical protein